MCDDPLFFGILGAIDEDEEEEELAWQQERERREREAAMRQQDTQRAQPESRPVSREAAPSPKPDVTKRTSD